MSTAASPARPGPLVAWLQAARPKTLPVAVVPVIVGSAVAYAHTGRFAADVFFVALLVALLIQVGTNLHNDAADTEKGADDPATRLGPARASAEGWLPAGRVKSVSMVLFAVAFFSGLYLCTIGGWPIFLLGVTCILAGMAYSGGPWPVAYSCIGELFVWLFFGLAAVGGTYYLQAGGQLHAVALQAGAAIGLPAAAILVVNNTRDIVADRAAGRRTFPVLFGAVASGVEYALLLIGAFAIAGWLSLSVGAWVLVVFVVLPWAIGLIRRFRGASGDDYNRLLADTARFQVGFGLLLSAGLVAA